jgi:hypothetical protein
LVMPHRRRFDSALCRKAASFRLPSYLHARRSRDFRSAVLVQPPTVPAGAKWYSGGLVRLALIALAASGLVALASIFGIARDGELPGFVRANPPKSTDSDTALPLAAEARQFFVTGEPEMADRYFPWLVNLMSPVYWVYLVMAVTVLFNAMRGFSRFRLWRIDAAREKLKRRIGELTQSSRPGNVAAHTKEAPTQLSADEASRDILQQLSELRGRCQRYTGSVVTPMGDEMFYRYQESLIDNLANALGAVTTPSSTMMGPTRDSTERTKSAQLPQL